MSKAPTAPKHLGTAGRKYFRFVASMYALDDDALTLLTQAAEMLDRAESARAIVAKEGLTQVDRFQQCKPHPCIEIERQSRLAFARLRRELNLDAPPADSRPPLPPGYR